MMEIFPEYSEIFHFQNINENQLQHNNDNKFWEECSTFEDLLACNLMFIQCLIKYAPYHRVKLDNMMDNNMDNNMMDIKHFLYNINLNGLLTYHSQSSVTFLMEKKVVRLMANVQFICNKKEVENIERYLSLGHQPCIVRKYDPKKGKYWISRINNMKKIINYRKEYDRDQIQNYVNKYKCNDKKEIFDYHDPVESETLVLFDGDVNWTRMHDKIINSEKFIQNCENIISSFTEMLNTSKNLEHIIRSDYIFMEVSSNKPDDNSIFVKLHDYK